MPDWASVTIEEASRMTGYNKEYLRRLIRDGKIEAVRFGPAYAIKKDNLLDYIKNAKGSGDKREGPREK